jgi:uncharacterized membrane protein YkoI
MYTLKPKKLILGSGATAALLGAFLMGGVALNHASAAPPATPGMPTTVVQGETPDTTEATDPAINPAQVKVTADQAKAAALAQFPGATIEQVELHDENGTLVWGVNLTDASGTAQDVKIDGASGQVVSTQADGPDGAEGPETPGN